MQHFYSSRRDLWSNTPILVTKNTLFHVFWSTLVLVGLNLVCSSTIVTLSTTLTFLALCLILTGCIYTAISVNYGYAFSSLTLNQHRRFRLAFGLLGLIAFALSCWMWARCTWEILANNSPFSIPILIFLFGQFLPPLFLLVAAHRDYSQYHTALDPNTKAPITYSQTFPEYAAKHS